MNKKYIIIGAILILISIAVAAAIFFWPQGETKPVSQTAKVEVSPSPKIETSHWDDPAGFTMDYPSDVTVNKHDEDQVNYAHVELTNPNHSGSIIIWVKDLPLLKGKAITSAQEWVSAEVNFKDANVLSTNLGEEDARKILISAPEKKLYIGTVYDGVLWYIEGTFDESEYWKEAFSTIVNSFAFKPIATPKSVVNNPPPVADDASVGSVDEEEVLE